MPSLPSGFVPTVAAYSHDSPGGVMRTEVAGGAARYALDWDRGLQKFSVTLILDKLQFSIWTAFFLHVIKKGALAYDMLLDSGLGVVTHTCNLMPGSYSATRTEGIATVVAFVVEAESSAYALTALEGAALVDLYNSVGVGSNALLAGLAQFATVDSRSLAF